MALLPKTTGELRSYLETIDDDTRIFIEDAEGYFCYFSIEVENVEEPTTGLTENMVYLSMTTRLDTFWG